MVHNARGVITTPTLRYGAPWDGMKDFEVDIVECLLASKLQSGFMVELLQDQSGYFKDWIRLDLTEEDDALKSKWFSRLLNWTRQPAGRQKVDACFRKVMAEFLHLIILAVSKRTNP
ncbi:hypothetical protein THAOC_19799, partial [Thalassiosira oceanica]